MSKEVQKPKKKVVSKSVKRRKKVMEESVSVKAPPKADYEQNLIDRISECEAVVNDLERSTVWRVIYNDLKYTSQMLDDNWQEIYDEQKLKEARILKLANNHILKLRDKYEEELVANQNELNKYRNQAEEVPKDYDAE